MLLLWKRSSFLLFQIIKSRQIKRAMPERSPTCLFCADRYLHGGIFLPLLFDQVVSVLYPCVSINRASAVPAPTGGSSRGEEPQRDERGRCGPIKTLFSKRSFASMIKEIITTIGFKCDHIFIKTN